MQDIRCYREEDVGKAVGYPKRTVNRFEADFSTGFAKRKYVVVGQMISFDGVAPNTRWECFVFAKLIWWDQTLGAATVVHAGYKSLLRVVTNESGQDRMAASPNSIRAHHGHALFSIGSDRS